MRITQLLIVGTFLLIHLSCDVPEHYFTPAPECISDTQDDLKVKRQEELVVGLKDRQPADYRYFFKSFKEEGSTTYMITNFRNDTSCFDIRVLVDKWDKLAGMRKANGESYPKELYDLTWVVTTIEGKDIVRYVDMHEIID